ncbi:MAG: PPC domain-containing protein [Candidatus Baltobacteraceae bacterium]
MPSPYALAVQEPRAGRAALYGTRAQLAATGGNVEGYLALAGSDMRAGTASYALRIDNASARALRARMTCVRLRGEVVPAYPLDVHVAPFSRCETLLPVRMDQIGRFDRAVVEVRGEDISFTLEAPGPMRQPRAFPWLASAAGALAFTLGASFAAASATPRMGMLAAPSRVFAGSPVEVPYAFAGWASMQYALRTNDGRQLAAGLLSEHEGTLRFNVPSSAGSGVVLSVNLAGPFGRRSSLQHIAIAAAARHAAQAKTGAQAPRISEFSVATHAIHAGGTIALNYATNAQDGDIWLIDESGRLWAKAPISSDGSTIMTLPEGTAGRQLRAVMRARSGGLDAVASLAVTVLPGALVQDSAPRAPAPPGAASSATLSLSASSAAAGQSITVSIAGARGDTTIALNDAGGNSVETGDIADGQMAMTITAPSAPGTYYLVASVSQGVSQQTLVKKLTVT